MARANVAGKAATKVTAKSPVKTKKNPSLRTHEGGEAWKRAKRSELFVLGSNLFDGEDTFYEKAKDRTKRWVSLCEDVAVGYPEWFAGFIGWLRDEGNIRTASIRGAVAGVHARLGDEASRKADHAASAKNDGRDLGMNRRILRAAISRADEPAEALAMWLSMYGRKVPLPVKKALADEADRLYSERNYSKWDKPSSAVRMADVLELAHPKGRAAWQGELYKYMIDRRQGHAGEIPESLRTLAAKAAVVKAANAGNTDVLTDQETLAAAGMTWEQTSSLGGGAIDKAAMWAAQIPTMGIFALTRNLRNFDEDGVSDEVAAQVMQRLQDPQVIRRSRMFPYRFYQAYREAPSDRWKHPLNVALDLSCSNIPTLQGKTLILIDTSASMNGVAVSSKSTMTYVQMASLFGLMLLKKNPDNVELWGFANGVFRHQPKRGFSVLPETTRFIRRIGEVGHGTEIVASIRATYSDHQRVIVITDMQAFDDSGGWPYYGTSHGTVTEQVPQDKFLYGFSLGGYKPSMMPSGSGTRHEMTGFTDTTFRIMAAVEQDDTVPWPWEVQDA